MAAYAVFLPPIGGWTKLSKKIPGVIANEQFLNFSGQTFLEQTKKGLTFQDSRIGPVVEISSFNFSSSNLQWSQMLYTCQRSTLSTLLCLLMYWGRASHRCDIGQHWSSLKLPRALMGGGVQLMVGDHFLPFRMLCHQSSCNNRGCWELVYSLWRNTDELDDYTTRKPFKTITLLQCAYAELQVCS